MRTQAIQRQWFHKKKNHANQANVEVFYLIGVQVKKEKIIKIIMNEWNENTSALPLRRTKGKRKYFHVILLLSTQFSGLCRTLGITGVHSIMCVYTLSADKWNIWDEKKWASHHNLLYLMVSFTNFFAFSFAFGETMNCFNFPRNIFVIFFFECVKWVKSSNGFYCPASFRDFSIAMPLSWFYDRLWPCQFKKRLLFFVIHI